MPGRAEAPTAPATPATLPHDALEYAALARALAAGLARLWRTKRRATGAQAEPLAAPAASGRRSPAA